MRWVLLLFYNRSHDQDAAIINKAYKAAGFIAGVEFVASAQLDCRMRTAR